jgi:hypothetical protein
MKIAILLTGHIRHNSILDGILRYCSNNSNIHIFIHTWDNLGYKGSETDLNAASSADQVLKEIHRYPNLKKYQIENNRDFVSSLPDVTGYFNFSSPEKFIKSQLYSVNSCYRLMEEYAADNGIHYDMILKSRFDLCLDHFDISQGLIDELKNQILFVPDSHGNHVHPDNGASCWACDNMYYNYHLKKVHAFEHTNVVCDIFAYGNMESMKQYCNLYNVYDSLNESFKENNLAQLERGIPVHQQDGNFYVDHILSMYYFYCSYPERLIPKYLKDFMLIRTTAIKLRMVR